MTTIYRSRTGTESHAGVARGDPAKVRTTCGEEFAQAGNPEAGDPSCSACSRILARHPRLNVVSPHWRDRLASGRDVYLTAVEAAEILRRLQ